MLKHLFFATLLALAPALSAALAQADEIAMASQARTVNINAADATTLASQLKGVGKSRAEAIVQYRETYGPFFSVEDLVEVKGIGKSVIERNRERITLE